MNKQPIISIIIPIYNIGEKIARCIDSLLDQGLEPHEYEIILIDDGSTDNSLSICQNYEKRYSNIIVKSQPNKGPGPARNLGLNCAQGEYIYMVDQDDYLIPNGLSFICKNFIYQYDCELLIFNTTIVRRYSNRGKPQGKILYEGQTLDLLRKYNMAFRSVYSFFCKRTFLNKNHITFPDMLINEDFIFFMSMVLLNPSVLYLSCNFYRYVIHDGSICTTRERSHNRKCINIHIQSIKKMHELLRHYQLKEYHPDLYQLYTKKFNSLSFHMYKKILCSEYDLQEYKNIITEFISLGLLPLEPIGNSIKCKVSRFIINLLMQVPVLYKPTSFLYNKIFVTSILPLIHKSNV